MAHYRMTDKLPSAIITVDGNEKKIYEGNQIFLQNGDNFEIRFFNPLQEKIGVELLFNSQKKNDGLLVLRPGEDITLDRFLGEKKKMKFDTYTIDGGNSAAVKAAEINGLVEFKFYKEKNTWYSTSFDNSATLTYTSGNMSYSCGGSSSSYFHSPGVFTMDLDNSVVTAGLTGSVTTDSLEDSVAEPETTIAGNPIGTRSRSLKSKSVKSAKVETGRIEKGPESTQEIKTVDAEFDTTEFHTITYQMKPNSHIPQDIVEVRNYCPNCQYRIRKKSWSFCPKCGEEL